MSSILEALRELEGGAAPVTQDAELFVEPPRLLRRVATGVTVGVLVAGAVAGGLWMRRTPTPPSAAPAIDPLPLAAPAPVPAAILDEEPPRARVVAAAPAPLPAAPERVAPPPAIHAPRRDMATVSLPRPIGEPRVQVSGVSYAPVAEDRTATLRINGGAPVTLHEGEAAGEVEVQLILADRVYVRHAGQIFAVSVRN